MLFSWLIDIAVSVRRGGAKTAPSTNISIQMFDFMDGDVYPRYVIR